MRWRREKTNREREPDFGRAARLGLAAPAGETRIDGEPGRPDDCGRDALSRGEDVFTNIQDGLRLAHRLLGQHPDAKHQVILITDGQPTAFTLNGQMHVEWPSFGVSPNAVRETLKQVRVFTRSGATINTFMLDRSPPLVRFVDEMTKINKGRAFFTAPDQLGQYLLVDYFSRKKRRVH